MFIERAVEAPLVRRLFSSSPKDPHYHMLSHLSAKFKQAADDQTHEPRAALFLNRFTRTLTIMYTTTGIQRIIGIPNENMTGRSFYYCIAENCLEDAVKCLETAKSNDSIAYLRFWFRDPRQDDQADPYTSDARNTDASVTDVAMSEDDEDDRASRRGSLPETVRILPPAALPYPANAPQLQLHPFQPSQLHRNLTSLKEEQLSWRLSSPAHLMASLSVSAVQGRRFLTSCKISPQFNRKRLPTVYLLRRGPSSQCTFHRSPSFQ